MEFSALMREAAMYRTERHPTATPQDHVLKIAEEVGELARCEITGEGRGDPVEEAADVFIALACYCAATDITLEAAVLVKFRQLWERAS